MIVIPFASHSPSQMVSTTLFLSLVLLGEHLGVHTLGLHTGLGGVGDVALVVLEALEGATAGLLGLLLLGDLGGLVLDLTGTSEGAVDLTHFVLES